MTYAEYTARGGALTQPAYDRISIGVMQEINRYTFGRAAKLSPVPEPVKRLIVELCELSSAYSTDTDANYRTARRELIYTYLAGIKTADGTPLLYRGADV